MAEAVPAMEKLRAETRDQHVRVEALPFFKALLAAELPLEGYVGLLRAMAIVHEALEGAIIQSPSPVLAAVWDDDLRRLPLIRRDLEHFEKQELPHLPAPTMSALVLAGQIRLRAASDPDSLLGYLYVLQGSALGGLVLRAHVARAFGLDGGKGLAYLSSFDRATRAHWERFGQRMNNSLADPALLDRVSEAAREAFEGIGEIVEHLFPVVDQPPRNPVSLLNREAGSHPVTLDPREIEAALRAGERSWQAFPYFELRYGARGRRFTRSDSAWIVTLTNHAQAVVDRHIRWLGGLLAARGMPQLLLEQHLEGLHAELVRAVPEKRAAYDTLLKAAHMLRDTRRAHIGDDVMLRLSSIFEAQAGVEWSGRLKGAGLLLVASVADEQAGITNAVASLESWMLDPARFPDTWIKAVRMTIRKAREQAT